MNTRVLSTAAVVYVAAFALFVVASAARKKAVGKAGVAVAVAGLVLHTAGIALRWVETYLAGAGHAPLSNFYESLVFFSWSVVFLAVVIGRGRARSEAWASVVLVACLLLAYASFSGSVDPAIRPLIPALKSDWLVIHVVTCFMGYAAFVLASVSGFTVARRARSSRGAQPEAAMLDVSLKTGYVLFSVGIVTGSLWAHMAWGRYWGWDPKETWALITWLIYTTALHVRVRAPGATGRIALMLGIGLASVLFTYFGVNYLPGLHSYQ